MIVIIREREYEYSSDHPDGWKRSKGDFKFPVHIGSNKCFIKRFNKRPATISGWQLLESLKGRYERNLPRIHDLVNIEEKRENIYYVFLEFIEGNTLSKLLSEHAEINLEKLTEDLFSAFQSLNKYGFWFADFFEKNICADARGNFFLVDLDSAQSTLKPPDIDMWGEKEYWALVSDFFKNILNKPNFKPSQISGIFLNYLQTIFLILRIKKYKSQKDKDYNEVNVLSSDLNKISPRFKEIFSKIFEHRYPENEQNIIREIKDLIKEKVISSGTPVSHSEPVIKKFSLNNAEETKGNFVVENGKTFTLNWEVENATDIQLYKNGQFFQKIQEGEDSIELAEEVYDREEKTIEFELIASASGEVVSQLLTVSVIQSEPIIERFEIRNYFEKSGDNYIVENDSTYILSWSIRNAVSIKLYKNGSVLNVSGDNKNELELKATIYDGKHQTVNYTLTASNQSKTVTKTLTADIREQHADTPPVIRNFKAVNYAEKNEEDYYLAENGKPFKIYWNVENAMLVKLYKNKDLYNEYNKSENTIELTETAQDGEESINQYMIVASNGSAKTESKSFTITVKGKENAAIAEFYLNDHAGKNGENYIVKNDKPFILNWKVKNVSGLELLRNGASYKILNPPQGQLELREKLDGQKEARIKYTLVASGGSEVKRNTVQITVRKSILSPVIVIAALIMLGIISTFIILNHGKNEDDGKGNADTATHAGIIFNPIKNDTIFENNTLRIAGKNLPENDGALEVKFNDSTGKILQHTKDAIDVLVPHLQADYVNIKVNVNDTSFTLSGNIPYAGKELVDNSPRTPAVYRLKISTINEGDILTIYGKFLLQKGVEVKFNNATGRIIKQSGDKIRVQVPLLTNGELINITTNIEGRTFTVASGVTFKSKVIGNSDNEVNVTLNPFNQNTITENEVITITGTNIPEEKGTVQVIFDGKVYFSIIEQSSTLVRVKVPTLVLKSGIIAVKVKGKFIPIQNNIVFYKQANR